MKTPPPSSDHAIDVSSTATFVTALPTLQKAAVSLTARLQVA
jgi:hypothetical protein